MRVIPPLEITPARLTSTTISEPHTPAEYNAGTTYSDGTMVSVAAEFRIYESLVSSNIGNTPISSPAYWKDIGPTELAYNAGTTYAVGDTVSYVHRVYESLQASNTGNTPISSASFWLDVGPTNAYAMFDLLRNTQTIGASPLTVVLTPGVRVDSIALLGLLAKEVTVVVTLLDVVVYSVTIDLDNRVVGNWYDYFFKPLSLRSSVVLFDLPPYTNAVITVTLTIGSGNVACGSLVLGSYEYLGEAEVGAESDVLNFSTVERDFAGNSVLIPRKNVPKTNQKVYVEKERVNRIRIVRDALNAAPAVWSGLDDDTNDYFEALLILGYYRRFTINLAHHQKAILDIELEEV